MSEAEEVDKSHPDNGEAVPTASFGAGAVGPSGQVGPYKLLKVLGEGGCGIVYLAERERPVRRRVALKIIKPGMDTKEVIARFEAERQALALLEHPNIARVFNAETTEAGRPYFVMEYVKGVPLTEHCDLQNLGIEERLALFLEVCEAVQYAHQKGIIHRDIKPSNILVSVQADKMVPKIIDFGVAKALSQSLTERTLVTEQGQMIGTPEYMSPEQAEMTNQDIDTRSDIYSLGVVLYELLTGVLPFDPKTLREGGADSIRKVIREEEPKTPSTRLSTLGGENSAKVARHRHADFGTLKRRLRGDLDWITLKALEKDRMRRYGSVGEFALDIRRHLKHEPVLARPPSTVYKIKKFVRRNRVSVTAVSAVAAALVVGLILSTTLYLRKKHALDTLAKLETTVEVDRHLSTVQKLYAEGRYQAALSEIEAHLQRRDAGPKVRLIHAHLLFDLDRFDEAAAELKELLTGPPETAGVAHYVLAKIYVGSDPNKSKEHQELGESLLPQTAEAYSLRGMAASTPEETLQWLFKAVELEPSHYPSRKARALAYYTLKDYANMAQDVEAMIVMRPKDSLGYALRAMVRRQTGRYDDAIKDHNHAIDICDVKAELAGLYDQRRETYVSMGNYRAALSDAQRCVQLEPGEFYYQFHVFTAFVALEEYEAAKEEYREIVGDDPSQAQQFAGRVVRHVFNTLGGGQQFELPEDITDEAPFFIMQEAANRYHRLQAKAVRLVPSVYGQSSWSPDGKQMAYGRTDMYEWQPKALEAGAPAIYGSSGIEILDLESGKIRLLVSAGKDPAWSPDGRYIAFVRVPRLRGFSNEEIWLIPVTGGEPRWLALGGWPIWASDSRRLFFHSRRECVLYSICVDEPTAQPKEIISCPGAYPAVSPDEKYVAYAVGNELRVVEIATDEVVTPWTAPGPERGMLVRWSPDGKEILVAGYHDSGLGTWSLDVQRKQAWQIFETPAMSANLSADRSKISFELRRPFSEIWLAALDPNIPIYKSVTPTLTREEFIRDQCQQYIRFVKSGVLTEESYSYLIKFMNSLGSQAMEQYRNAEYEEALVTLTGIDAIHRALNKNESRPSDLAFIAMSLHQLGRDKEAQAALDQLRRLFEDDGHTEEERYLYEAEKLFAGEDNTVYRAWECLEAGKLKDAWQLLEELRSLPHQEYAEIAGDVKSVIKALARAYCNRGRSATRHGGRYGEAIGDYQAAVRVDPNYAVGFADLAWLRAACPASKFRDEAKAVEYATKACELSSWKDHRCVGTLAAVCAEAGDFQQAIKRQKEAIDLLPEDQRSTLQANYESRLKLYQSGKRREGGGLWGLTGEMVGWWKFDETEGQIAVDSSDSGMDGELVGDAHIIADPVRGNVLSLDGDGDYVNCGKNPAFDLTDEITVAAWVNITTVPTEWTAIVTKGDSAWRLSTVRDERRFHFAVTPGDIHYINGDIEVAAGEWHHVCGTYDGAYIRLYLDGAEDSKSPLVYSGSVSINLAPVFIGANSEQTGRYWNGLIDDVRIYSYALSEHEIRALYAGKGPGPIQD